MSKYLQIDERSNIIDSLQKAQYFIQITDDDFSYKWFCIAFHQAVHCLMLYALINSDQSGIWLETKKLPIYRTIDKWTKVPDVFNPKNKLIDFLKAYEWIQEKNRMNQYIHSKPFVGDTIHKESMEKLNNDLRNKFIHYPPIGPSIYS